ncbi:hypothetical protein [Mycetocola reblochoni]|uniref:hypothetical protein n=1 Tax=Mycetocola reblochoni TaxID=331618 RepID=UPI003F9A38E4
MSDLDADAQTELLLDAMPGLLSDDAQTSIAAAHAMLDTVTGPAHYSGLCGGLAASAAHMLRLAAEMTHGGPLPDNGVFTYDDAAAAIHAPDERRALQIVNVYANQDHETAVELIHQACIEVDPDLPLALMELVRAAWHTFREAKEATA